MYATDIQIKFIKPYAKYMFHMNFEFWVNINVCDAVTTLFNYVKIIKIYLNMFIVNHFNLKYIFN